MTGFLEPVTGAAPVGNGLEAAALAATATVISIVALALTWWIYGSGRVDWIGFRERLEPLPRAALNGWYVDRAYDTAVIQPAKAGAWITAYVIDGRIIDGAVNAIGGIVKRRPRGRGRCRPGPYGPTRWCCSPGSLWCSGSSGCARERTPAERRDFALAQCLLSPFGVLDVGRCAEPLGDVALPLRRDTARLRRHRHEPSTRWKRCSIW